MPEIIGKVPFSETRTAMAVSEMLRERLDSVIKHCQDPRTIEGEPCEVNIKVRVVPNKRRDGFMFEVSAKAKFSNFESDEAQLYTRIDENGEVQYVQFDPANQLPFE